MTQLSAVQDRLSCDRYPLSLNMTGRPNLQLVKSHLQQIYDSISQFQPLTPRPPILDSSFEAASESNEESQWLKQENIPGLKKLKENIGIDLAALEKVLLNHPLTN